MELPLVSKAAAGSINVEQAVRERYSATSQDVAPSLCCAVQYDDRYLKLLPPEILNRDYGCGDPSRFVRPRETVLDLGCGAGKVCYIASQIVGPGGRVVGIDKNDDMLALARRYQRQVAGAIGWDNVEFRRGRIQDLALNLDLLEALLQRRPVASATDWSWLQGELDRLRRTQPLVASESIDVVLSNCVLNLVAESDRKQLFAEVFRVLRPGGRAAISDIVSDQPVPDHLKNDPELWSGCISGAFEESAFLRAFADAGFMSIEQVSRQEQPWTVVEGIEFRSVTVLAHKPHADGTWPTHGCCQPACCQ
jgi:ubiquinone/menaquinone biosynthesis C-methylase UbiE